MNRQQFLQLIEPALQLVDRKGKDYNTGPTLEQYFPFGDASYIQMIHLKSLRLVATASKGAVAINFESKKDSTLDLINYCVFYLAHLEAQEPV